MDLRSVLLMVLCSFLELLPTKEECHLVRVVEAKLPPLAFQKIFDFLLTRLLKRAVVVVGSIRRFGSGVKFDLLVLTKSRL